MGFVPTGHRPIKSRHFYQARDKYINLRVLDNLPVLRIKIFHTSKGGCDRRVVGFTATYAISTYNHSRCELESHSGETTLCDKLC
jgi:hypothetical protein